MRNSKGGDVGNRYGYGVVGNWVEKELATCWKNFFSTCCQCFIHAVFDNEVPVIHISMLEKGR